MAPCNGEAFTRRLSDVEVPASTLTNGARGARADASPGRRPARLRREAWPMPSCPLAPQRGGRRGHAAEALLVGMHSGGPVGSAWPTFSIVRQAVTSTRVDFSPCGQSVFADAVDAVRAVDLSFDALTNDGDSGRPRLRTTHGIADGGKAILRTAPAPSDELGPLE